MNRLETTQVPDFQKRYAVLLDIGRVLTGTLLSDELYRTIYEQASRVLETTGFYISLYDADKDLATIVFSADRGEIERPGLTYPGSRSRAITEARPLMQEMDSLDEAIMLLGEETDHEVTRSIITAPMLREGHVLGVISAQSYSAGAYTDDDLELMRAIADLAAVAVHNARSVQELERQRRESERLEAIGRALASSLELNEVLERIVTATGELVDADGAGVWLLRPDGLAEISMTAGEMALPKGTTMPIPDDVYRLLREQEGPLTFDFRKPNPLLPEEIRKLFLTESGLAVPLVSDGELIGALSVSHAKARDYPPQDVRLLERFAVHAAIAVANARLHEQVRFLSLTDPLTELPNRRHMGIFLEKEFAAAQRGRALTVVLFDLDDFKIYNDAAGHQAGDAALRRFARILAAQTRAMNLAARYGGDEFICILSDTDLEGGQVHVSRIARAVRADEQLATIGVTAGIATFDEGMKAPTDLVGKADQELYRAKADRNRGIPAS